MSVRPLVSIVTPSLNQGRFIRAAIDSVLAQDYPLVEHIVVDGGSRDETFAILDAYRGRIRWISEPDAGQTEAVNKGFRLARGEVIGWLNADDLFLPGAVAAAVGFLERHPDVDLVYGDAYHIGEDGGVIGRYPTEPFSLDRLRETCFICQPAAFFRRRVLATIGMLDERLNCSMDYDFWIRIALQGRIAHLPVALAQSRLHPAAKTTRLRVEHQRASMEVVKRHFGVVPPSWLCAYAGCLVERALPRKAGWQNAIFAAAVTLVATLVSLRVNGGFPPGALRQWREWMRRALAEGDAR